MSVIASKSLSRRTLLKGMASVAGAALPLSLTRGVLASTHALGNAEIQILTDGNLSLPIGFVLPDRSKEEVEALFAPHNLPTDSLAPDCNITLYRKDDRLVLFDAGAGANFQASAGQLVTSLEDAGIDPADITDVVFTHAHPDHLWGVLDDFDDPLFTEAQHWAPQAEWDYWRADDTLANMPEERKSFVVGAQSRFEAIEDQVVMIKPGQEVVPGVEAVDTSGHTPGHMSFMIHGGSESVLVVGDAITNVVISFERPDWLSGSDQDREKGAATRLALLDRLAADKSRIIGFHLPHPGLGGVEKAGSAYRFVPES